MKCKNAFLLLFVLLLISITAVSATKHTDNSISCDNVNMASSELDNIQSYDHDVIKDNSTKLIEKKKQNLKKSSGIITITKDNYEYYFQKQSNSYIPKSSNLIQSGDTVKLKGTFTNVNFTVDKSITLTGYDANTQLYNCTVFVVGGNSSNSIIKDLKITNNGTLLRAIQVKNSSNLIIENNIIKTYGLRSYGFVADYMTNSTIRYNDFKREGDDWRYITFVIGNSHHNNILNNTIECGGANGIYLSIYGSSEADFDGGPSNYNNIRGNKITARGNITSWCYTIQVMGANNNIINNTVDGGFRGISTQDYENNIISGNDVHAISTGIYACEKANVSNNNIHVNGSAFGITVGGDNVCITNNTINSVDGQAIEIRANNVNITNNTLISTNSMGIHSKGKYSHIVIDNNKITSKLEGILFRKQSNTKKINHVLISRNNIVSQTDYAIDLLEAGSSDASQVNITIDSSNVLKSGKGSGSNAYLRPENVNDETLFDSNQTIVIKESNYNQYFTDGISNSKIEQNATIYLEGTFTNHNFTFNKKVHVIGRNCVIDNGMITLTGDAHSSTVTNLKINNNRKNTICHGIEVVEVNNCEISNVVIDTLAESESLGIFIYGANGNKVSGCNITTNSDYINNAILLYSSDSNVLEKNILHVKQSNVSLAYDDSVMFNEKIGTITEVLHNHGIILLYSSENSIKNNTVKVTSGFKNYTFPTNNCKNSIVGIDIYFDSHNNQVSYNNISFTSYCPYVYGMGVLGGNWGSSITSLNATANKFMYNTVNLNGGYFVTGFIAGRNSIGTVVESNNIKVNAYHNNTNRGDYSHAVTLENSTHSTLSKNNISITGSSVYPFELFDSSYNNISNNSINANATYPYGISGYRTSYNNITNNTFTLRKYNYGQTSTAAHSDVIESGDDGIMLMSYSSYNRITGNMIDTNATNSVKLTKDTRYNNVTNNSLKAKNTFADKSVLNEHSTNIVSNNFLYFVDITANPITAHLGDLINLTAVINSNTENLKNLTVTFRLGQNTLGSVNVTNHTVILPYTVSKLLNPTTYTLTISARGVNFQNTSMQTKATFLKEAEKTVVSVAKVLNTLGSTATITANITTSTGGKIGTGQATIYLDNKKLATVNLNLGVVKYNYPISNSQTIGVHTIKVTYLGTDSYKSATGTNILGIQTKTDITSNNYVGTIGKSINIKANIKSGNININNGKLKTYIANKLIEEYNITKGVVNYNYTIPTSMDKGEYNLTFIYDGNESTSAARKTVNIKINPMTPVFSYNKTIVRVDTNASLILKIGNGLSNKNYYPADGGNVSVKLNNKVLTDTNGKNITGIVKNGSITFNFIAISQLMGNNNITFNYYGNSKFSSYSQTYANGLVVVKQYNTDIRISTVRGIIGEKLTLKANITDVNKNRVTNGYVIFKLNGITIKDNGKLTGSTTNLKVYVKNGTATTNITADLNMRNAKTLTAVYSGSTTYNASRSNTATAQIALRNASIEVSSNVKTIKQGQYLTITAKIYDITTGQRNTTLAPYTDEYVYFKVNGITLKDEQGNALKVKVVNSTATTQYYIPLGLSAVTDGKTFTTKNHTILAGYANKNYYPTATNTSTFQTERSNITIQFQKTIINKTSHKLSLNATIKDYLQNKVIGPNKYIIKINGITIKNSDKPQYFYATNGNININNLNIPSYTTYKSIEIVTQDRLAYKSQRNMTTIIKTIN